MIFDSLALLAARPVHEEAIRQVNHEDRPDHLDAYAESGNAGEQSDNQSQSAKEFSADDQKRHGSGYSHVLKESHGAVKTVASEPAQHFLRPMREEQHTENHSQSGQAHVVACPHQLLHRVPSWQAVVLTQSRGGGPTHPPSSLK